MATTNMPSQATITPSPSDYELPLINRPDTIFALIILFQAVTWVAVFLRIYARIRPQLCLSWDDFFVVLAAASTTAGSVGVCMQVQYGLGKRWVTVDPADYEQYFFWTYVVNPTYATSLAAVKISILLQYLRLCSGTAYKNFRRTCIIFIVLSAMWGITYFFLMVFCCVPIRAFWEIPVKSGEVEKCILYGSRNAQAKVQGYITHSASNMVLDIIIFCLPLHFFYNMEMEKKSRWGLCGVFTIGAIIITVAIVRFANLVRHELGLSPEVFDVTFYAVPIIILSSLEVMIATIAASIPIFWPLVETWKTNAILIISEVTVKSEKRVMNRVDSAAALRDDWQQLDELPSSKSDKFSKNYFDFESKGRTYTDESGIPKNNLVFPGSDDSEPGLHVTETTVQGGGRRF